jgi:hypothetical protein
LRLVLSITLRGDNVGNLMANSGRTARPNDRAAGHNLPSRCRVEYGA